MAITFVGQVTGNGGRDNDFNGLPVSMSPVPGVQAGDLLVAFRSYQPSGTDTAPSGWTLLQRSNVILATSASVWWRFATGSEAAQSWPAQNSQQLVIGAWRGVDTTSPVVNVATSRTDTNAPTAPAITPAAQPATIIRHWSVNCTGGANWATVGAASAGTVLVVAKAPLSPSFSNEYLTAVGAQDVTSTTALPAATLSVSGVTTYTRGQSFALRPAADATTPPPSAPTGLTATADADSIDLAWTAPSGVTGGYNVYRRISSGSFNYGAPLNGGTPVSGNAYSDTTATPGTTYAYVVRARGGSPVAESVSSSEASATIAATPPPAGTEPFDTLPSDLTRSSTSNVVIDTGTLKVNGGAWWYLTGSRAFLNGDFDITFRVRFNDAGTRDIANLAFWVTSPGASVYGFCFRAQSGGGDGGFFVIDNGSHSPVKSDCPDFTALLWYDVRLAGVGGVVTATAKRVDNGTTHYSGSFDYSSYFNGSRPRSGYVGEKQDGASGPNGHSFDFLTFGAAADATPPVVNLTTGASQKVSATVPYTYSFAADEACQAWKVKVVPSSSSPHTDGTQIEAGGAITAGQAVTGSITAAELQTAGVSEGSAAYVKFFAQDTGGSNWST